ncbi:MAG: tetratricopeptide repeat protein [Prevotella sp.]|nr:tetratricopeptide repeat protein [Prevotella sp.]
MEQKDNMLIEALRYVNDKQLLHAIDQVKHFLEDNPGVKFPEQLYRIEDDYRLMLNYMRDGFVDPQRERVYNTLLERMFKVIQDLRIEYHKKNVAFYVDATRHSLGYEMSNDAVKNELESYVADLAMLSLLPEDERTGQEQDVHKRHSNTMSRLFNDLVTAPHWSENNRVFYEQLLLSPTIDMNDALTMVSAIMLSTMNFYDFQKICMLVHVYMKAEDERLRQRSLVGWVFTIHSSTVVDAKLDGLLREVFADGTTARELADMQKQVLFCMNAENDTETIQREIIPTLMKNNNISINRQGIIIEKEDDTMEDILHPDAADKKMEEVEQSIQQMMNMQKAGADIYFGGFSQMKRLPFFYDLGNWFRPFSKNHPSLGKVKQKLKGSVFFENLLNSAPFCDSDKYSFALVMENLVDRLPENMREMLDDADSLGPVVPPEESSSGAFIRRMYLQDLYRFFRLHHNRVDVMSPFSKEEYVFVANPSYLELGLDNCFADLCIFMRKHKNMEAFGRLASLYDGKDDPNSMLYSGIYLLEVKMDIESAIACFEKLLSIDPDNERAKSLLARSYFEACRYDLSCSCYEQLSQSHPDNKGYLIHLGIALSYAGKCEEAVKLYYQLHYEQPESKNIQRGLAWALMGVGKFEQAEKMYDKVLDAEKKQPSDYLNAGYCQWLAGRLSKAVAFFASFLSEKHAESTSVLEEEMKNDHDFLTEHGLKDTDIQLMCDLVTLA